MESNNENILVESDKMIKRGRELLNKVPEVTIFFWIIKVLCTTVGETVSDFLNVSMGLGLTLTTTIVGIVFSVVVFFQFRARKYKPGLYWLTVVLLSVFGTLITDNMTDYLGVPLIISTTIFTGLLLLTFLFWYLSEKTLSIHAIDTTKREGFYWLTILFTFALGTAVGDLISEQIGLGYLNTGILISLILISVILAWKFLNMDSVLAFWVAYIFTRPLGASLGDYLSQPMAYGGLGIGATFTSVVFLTAIVGVIIFLTATKWDTEPKKESLPLGKSPDRKRHVLLQTMIVLGIFIGGGIGSYVWGSNVNISGEVSQTTLSGQLTNFITIEEFMQNSVKSNDFVSAKTSASDLEQAWDASAAKLKKMDSGKWSQLDGTIDDVLYAVRSKNPDVGNATAAIETSLEALNEANK